MNIVIFGAGDHGKRLLKWFNKHTEDKVICFLDNSDNKSELDGVKVYLPEKIKELNYDQIIISNKRPTQRDAMKNQLKDMGIDEKNVKILMEDEKLYEDAIAKTSYFDESDPRINWIHGFADYVKEQNMGGSIAECGVFLGDCSHYINKYFSDRKLYLFDTFEGFDNRDLNVERDFEDENFAKGHFNHEWHFDEGVNLKHLALKMPHFDKCVIKKGYFPETTKDVDDKFVFVNLDMDLYQPQLAGLNFFYDRMVKGGVILLHDYFHPELPGVKKAVADFQKERGLLPFFPIGDFCSIALIKA